MFKFKKEQARQATLRARQPILPTTHSLPRTEDPPSSQDPSADPVQEGETEEINGRICRIRHMFPSPASTEVVNGVRLQPEASWGYQNALINQNCIFVGEDEVLYMAGRFLAIWNIVHARMRYVAPTPSRTATSVTALHAFTHPTDGQLFAIAERARPNFRLLETARAHRRPPSAIPEEVELTPQTPSLSSVGGGGSTPSRATSQAEEEEEDDDWQVIVRIYRQGEWLSLQHTPLTLNASAVVTQIGFLPLHPRHCFTVSIVALSPSVASKKLCYYNWQRKVVLFEEVLPENSHVLLPLPDRHELLLVGKGLLATTAIAKHGLLSPTSLLADQPELLDNEWIDAKVVLQTASTYYLVAASRENAVCVFKAQSSESPLRLEFVFRAQFHLRHRLRPPSPRDDTDPETSKDFLSVFPDYPPPRSLPLEPVSEEDSEAASFPSEPSAACVAPTKTGFVVGADQAGLLSFYDIREPEELLLPAERSSPQRVHLAKDSSMNIRNVLGKRAVRLDRKAEEIKSGEDRRKEEGNKQEQGVGVVLVESFSVGSEVSVEFIAVAPGRQHAVVGARLLNKTMALEASKVNRDFAQSEVRSEHGWACSSYSGTLLSLEQPQVEHACLHHLELSLLNLAQLEAFRSVFSRPLKPLFGGGSSSSSHRPLPAVGATTLLSMGGGLLASYSDDHYLRVFSDESKLEELASWRCKERVTALTVHPLGLQLAVGMREGFRVFFFLEGQRLGVAYEAMGRTTLCAAYSHGGQFLALSLGTRTQVLDPYSFATIFTLPSHPTAVRSLLWSAYDNRLISVCSHAVYGWSTQFAFYTPEEPVSQPSQSQGRGLRAVSEEQSQPKDLIRQRRDTLRQDSADWKTAMVQRQVTTESSAGGQSRAGAWRFEYSVRSVEVAGVAHDQELDLYLVASRDNRACLVEGSSGRELAWLQVGSSDSAISTVALAARLRCVVFGFSSGKVRVYNWPELNSYSRFPQFHELFLHCGPLQALLFSSNALLAASSDGVLHSLRLQPLRGGKPAPMPVHLLLDQDAQLFRRRFGYQDFQKMQGELHVLVDGGGLRRTALEELGFQAKNVEQQLEYELEAARTQKEQHLARLQKQKATRLEAEKRSFQLFHQDFQTRRAGLLQSLEEQLRGYIEGLGAAARQHSARMADAEATSNALSGKLERMQNNLKQEVETLTQEHLEALGTLQADYLAQAQSAEERKASLQAELEREAAKFASSVEQDQQEYEKQLALREAAHHAHAAQLLQLERLHATYKEKLKSENRRLVGQKDELRRWELALEKATAERQARQVETQAAQEQLRAQLAQQQQAISMVEKQIAEQQQRQARLKHFQTALHQDIEAEELREGPLTREVRALEGDVRQVHEELEKEGARKEAFSLALAKNKKLFESAQATRLRFQEGVLVSRRKVESLLHRLSMIRAQTDTAQWPRMLDSLLKELGVEPEEAVNEESGSEEAAEGAAAVDPEEERMREELQEQQSWAQRQMRRIGKQSALVGASREDTVEEAVQEKRRLIEDCKELQDRKFLLLCALLKVKEEVEGYSGGPFSLSPELALILENMRTLCPIVYHAPFSHLQPFSKRKPLQSDPAPQLRAHLPDRLQRQADFLDKFVARQTSARSVGRQRAHLEDTEGLRDMKNATRQLDVVQRMRGKLEVRGLFHGLQESQNAIGEQSASLRHLQQQVSQFLRKPKRSESMTQLPRRPTRTQSEDQMLFGLDQRYPGHATERKHRSRNLELAEEEQEPSQSRQVVFQAAAGRKSASPGTYRSQPKLLRPTLRKSLYAQKKAPSFTPLALETSKVLKSIKNTKPLTRTLPSIRGVRK